MKLLKFAFLAILFSTLTIEAQEISDTSFGKGIINYTAKDSTFSIKFAPRIQFRSETNWDYNGNNYNSPEHNFLIRRARLKFDGWAYSPKLEYKIELGLSNRDISGANEFNRNTPRYILDAVIMWNFYENFELWVGQTKLPGNVERVVSSANMQLIDRSLLNSRFNIDRDIGMQLRHHANLGGDFIIREKVAVSQGEGRNITEGNEGGLQYTGRLEFLPFGSFKSNGDYFQADLAREASPKLMIGVTYDLNQDAVKTRSNLGSYMFLEDGSLYETDITTLFVDTMFKYKGFSFMGEYANRDAENPVAMEADGTETGDIVLVGNALNLQAGYLFKNNYEIAGRFTTTDYNKITSRLGEEQYTLGVSKYIVGHKLKVQSDVSYTTLKGDADSIEFRIGFDLHF
ncbi:OprO/OprP family phosphate-selective porin [Aureisphaera sp. CAU 1614]|uniref:OprO/OprP family phosphate-selective porin n=1 Tax=Halomarinibacterium sedimenti TaxID=2857106 RepID=A0A9X1JZJ6_9FLAO|nr:porin [Halomarinibacterium sedimenti]MBW2938552.1 OprO/OprP family phosphate-selective porin [Halomarinibacterium sedimenti]